MIFSLSQLLLMHSCSSNNNITLCCNTLRAFLFGVFSFIFSTRIDGETLIVWCNVISYRYGQMAHSVFNAIIYIQKKIFFLFSSPRSCPLITYILHPAASAPTCTKHISMQFNIAAYNQKTGRKAVITRVIKSYLV